MTRDLPADPLIRSLVQRARAAQLTRRGALGLAGAGALSIALAACSTGAAPKAAADLSRSDRTVVWTSWPLYLDTADDKTHPTLTAFEKKTGIRASYREDVTDNLAYFASVKDRLVQGEDIGTDTVVLTDWMVSRWVRFGYAQKLDHSRIPNLANLNPKLRDVGFDPGRRYTVPWQGGFAGIAWNKEEFPNGFGAVSEMFAEPRLKGRIEVLSEMRDTVGLIMLENGVGISEPFPDGAFERALEVIRKNIADGVIRGVKGNSYTDDLVSGRALAAIAWSGDIASLNAEHGDKWEFALPDAGGTLWNDNFIIPIGSRHKANAEQLIDWYYQPEVAAEVAAYVNYITPVVGAQEAAATIDPALAENTLIFPDARTLARAKIWVDLDPATDQSYSAAFQEVLLSA
ncbi:polyamine ABC transporter substrate-binding protein [Pseudolysinimonas sp.]|uniref:polyamine ABC transporter substrate-binding protein n=1 Tax=Pseudolysinimonas sp. TaxID=2680009 RepID=UPI003F7E2E7D